MKDDARKFFWLSLLILTIAVFVSRRLDHGILSAPAVKGPASVINTLQIPAQVQSKEQKANPEAEQKELIPVLRVIDGDTIVANIGGLPVHVRLIGIDSPELNDKRAQVACLAQKAKEEAEKLLDGQNIYLEKDSTQGDYDKYNRLLAYVFLSNGSTSSPQGNANFNKLMIEEGYAYEYTYNLPYKYQKEFKAAQSEARTAQKGLWNQNTCSN